MRISKKITKFVLFLLLTIMLMTSITGCAWVDDMVAKVKGELIGQEFEIMLYDHQANKTLTVSGSKVTVSLLENSANFNVESTGFKSEVIEVTINGNQMLQVGNTVIFAEKGLDMVTDFKLEEEIHINSGGGFVPYDRVVNNVKNKIGKSKTVVISSQLGIPIGVYQGDSVYVTIPDDLPKMTRLNVDGKSLYIHRANYVILDSGMID